MNVARMAGVCAVAMVIVFSHAQAADVRIEVGDLASNRLWTFSFSAPLSTTTRLRLYVATPRSILKVPFVVKDIALP